MAVRSTALVGPRAVPTAATLLYVTPAGRTAVVKEIVVKSSLSLPTNFELLVDQAAGVDTCDVINQSVAGGAFVRLTDLFYVLPPGFRIRTPVTAAGFNIFISGALLFGSPT